MSKWWQISVIYLSHPIQIKVANGQYLTVTTLNGKMEIQILRLTLKIISLSQNLISDIKLLERKCTVQKLNG